MPSFDKIKVKHLEVKKSQKTLARDVAIVTSNIDSSHSGTTYRVKGLTNDITLTLPHAHKGRSYTFFVTATNTGDLTITTQAPDKIVGMLLSYQGTYTTNPSMSPSSPYVNSVLDTTVTIVATNPLSISYVRDGIYNIPATTSTSVTITTNASIGTLVELTCLADGFWYVSGNGYNSDGDTDIAIDSTAVLHF